MEQVLRKFYNRKHTQIQRHKLQSQLQLDRRAIRQKYKGLISKQYQQPFTPSTEFSLDQQYKYKKELSFGNSFILSNQNQNQIDLQVFKSHQQTFYLPKIRRTSQTYSQKSSQLPKQSARSSTFSSRKKNNRNFKLLFRTKVFAIMFILRLKKNYKTILMINKTQMQKYASQFLQIVNKTVNLYYAPLLKNQLSTYFTLLQVQIKKPGARLTEQILNLLMSMTQKLTQSTIRKDLLHFLSLVSNQNSFFPSDFLTQPQINRLNFNPKLSSLQNITQDQSRMIIALCLGIKIFCVYVIYKPWLLNVQHPDITSDAILKYYKRAKKLIFEVGSIFYNIIIQQYLQILEIKTKQKDKIKFLNQFQLNYLSPINIQPEHVQISSEEEDQTQNQKQKQQEEIKIIKYQNKDFYAQLQKQFPDKIDSIRINIIKWLDRIYLGVKNYRISQLNKRLQKRKKEKLIIQDKILQIYFNQKLQKMSWQKKFS